MFKTRGLDYGYRGEEATEMGAWDTPGPEAFNKGVGSIRGLSPRGPRLAKSLERFGGHR